MTPYRRAAGFARAPQASGARLLWAHLRGLPLRLWLRDRGRQPRRVRRRRNVGAIGVMLVGMLGAGLFGFTALGSPEADPQPLVTWTRGAKGGDRQVLTIDTAGHYVALVARGGALDPGQVSRRTAGTLPPLELGRLRDEVDYVIWGRASYSLCTSAECETVTVGTGPGAVTVSLERGRGSSAVSTWEAPPVWRLVGHVGAVYERVQGEADPDHRQGRQDHQADRPATNDPLATPASWR